MHLWALLLVPIILFTFTFTISKIIDWTLTMRNHWGISVYVTLVLPLFIIGILGLMVSVAYALGILGAFS